MADKFDFGIRIIDPDAPQDYNITVKEAPEETPSIWDFGLGVGAEVLAGIFEQAANFASIPATLGSKTAEELADKFKNAANRVRMPNEGLSTVEKWAKGAAGSTAQSIAGGLPIVGKLKTFKGGVIGTALITIPFAFGQYRDVMKTTEEILKKSGATEAEINDILSSVKPYAAISGTAEAGGEFVSDFVTLFSLGLLGQAAKKTVKPAVKAGIMKALKYGLSKLGVITAGQEAGEIGTTITQYMANEAIGLPQQELLDQLADTVGVTGFQSLMMTALGLAFARTKGKPQSEMRDEIKKIGVKILTSYGVDEGKAGRVMDEIANNTTKTSQLDRAISQADEYLKRKEEQKTKPKQKRKREKKPVEAKPTEAKPTEAKPVEPEEVIEKEAIIAPAILTNTGRMIYNEAGDVKAINDELKASGETAVKEGFTFVDAETKTPEPRVLDYAELSNILSEKGIVPIAPNSELKKKVENGILETKKQEAEKQNKELATFVFMSYPLKKEERAVEWGAEKVPWVYVEKTGNVVPYNPERHILTNKNELDNITTKAESEKLEVKFTGIEIERTGNAVDVKIKVDAGDGKISDYNPDTMDITNKEEARKALSDELSKVGKTEFKPETKAATTRERRLKKLKAKTVTEITEDSTVDDILNILNEKAPGTVTDIVALTKKGFTTNDLLDDPDIKAALTPLAKPELWRGIIMAVKEVNRVATVEDILDQQVRDSLAELDKDLAKIDQELDPDIEAEPSVESDSVSEPGFEDNKEEMVERIVTETNVNPVYPTSIVTESEAIRAEKSSWYMPPEETDVRLEGLRNTRLDWNSDPYTILTAIAVNINKSLHSLKPVDYRPLLGFEQNLKYFKQALTLTDFEVLQKELASLKEFAKDVEAYISSKIIKKEKPSLEKPVTVEQTLDYDKAVARLEEYCQNNEVFLKYLDEVVPTFATHNKIAEILNGLLKAKKVRSILGNIRMMNDATISNMAVNFNKETKVAVFLKNPEYIPSPYVTGFFNEPQPNTLFSDLLHEVVHALTYFYIEEHPIMKYEINDIRKQAVEAMVDPDERDYVNNLTVSMFTSEKGTDLIRMRMPKTTSTLSMMNLYYLHDVHEFISGAMSDAVFQSSLAFIPYKSPALKTTTDVEVTQKPKSLFKAFKDTVVKIINSYFYMEDLVSPSDQTLLTATIDKFTTIMQNVKGKAYSPQQIKKNIKENEVAKQIVLSSLPRFEPLEADKINKALNKAGVTGVPAPIFIKPKPEDISEWSTFFLSPYFALRKFPEAAKVASKAIEAIGLFDYNTKVSFQELELIMKDLNSDDRKRVTKLLRDAEEGKTIDLDNEKPEVAHGYKRMRNLFDLYKWRYQNFMRYMSLKDLNQVELHVYEDVIVKGKDLEPTVKFWNKVAREYNKMQKEKGSPDRLATTSIPKMKKIFEDHKKIEEWGIEKYVTHAMLGKIAIFSETMVDEESPKGMRKLIGFADSIEKATQIAATYSLAHPEVDVMYIDPAYRFDEDIATAVPRGKYFALKRRMAKELDKYADLIGKNIREKLKEIFPGKALTVKPALVWSRFLQERQQELIGEEDIFDIMPAYIISMEKKMALDPYIDYYKSNEHKFRGQPNIKKMLLDQMEAVRGRYTTGDWLVDGLINRVIGKILPVEGDFEFTKLMGKIRNLEANIKLGYRIVPMVVNFMSGMGHTWVKTGLPYIMKAKEFLSTDEGKKFLARHAPNLGTSLIEGMGGDLTSRTEWWKPLGLFQMPEVPNRSISFVASYLIGKEKMGLNEEEAVEFAKRSVDLQQFNYSVAAIPKFMRGPLGKTIFQFKTYLVKELEFIAQLKGIGEWAKYLAMQTMLAGPRGLLITLKSLPILWLINGDDWLEQLERWLNQVAPRVSRGIFGFFGVDISAPATFQFPERWEEWAGITVGTIKNIIEKIFSPMLGGEPFLMRDVYEFFKSESPALRYWFEVIDSLTSPDGWILNDKGQKVYKPEGIEDYVKMLAGAKPLKYSVEMLEYNLEKKEEMKQKKIAEKIVTEVVKRWRKKDPELMSEEIVNLVGMYAINPTSIAEAIKRSELDPLTRRLLGTAVARRLGIYGHQIPIREFID